MRFRLVDMLVTALVIAILIALLLPALMRSTEGGDSRRTFCMNNLRQGALGLVLLENQKQSFPGYLNRVGNQPASWVVPTLGYLEHQGVLEAWQANRRPKPEPQASRLHFFVCPSDDSGAKVVAPLSYVANAGIPDSAFASSSPGDKLANGVFHNRFDSTSAPAMTVAFLNAHDGATHTLLLSENIQAGQWAGNGQYDTLPNGGKVVAPTGFFTPEQAERLTTIVWHPSQAVPTTAVAERRVNVGHDSGLDEAPTLDFARPSSFHRGGANVAMADSSVRFLSDEIDYGVYVALMTPDGANSDAPDTPIASEPSQTWRTTDAQWLDRLIGQN